MESIFGQGLDSEERNRGSEAETLDDHETTEDEPSKNLDLCTDGNDKIIELSVEALPINPDALEPYIGMEFKSRDEAREFYVAFGQRIGFTVRIHHNRRSRLNNAVIGQDFVCSKEGFRAKKYEHRKDRTLPPLPVTREGCNAMLRRALRDAVKWVVTKFVKEHSHKLMSPSKVPWRRSERILISEDEKDKKIRELSLELYNEKRRCQWRCAAYQEQLNMIFKDVEEHTQHLSRKVQDTVKEH